MKYRVLEDGESKQKGDVRLYREGSEYSIIQITIKSGKVIHSGTGNLLKTIETKNLTTCKEYEGNINVRKS